MYKKALPLLICLFLTILSPVPPSATAHTTEVTVNIMALHGPTGLTLLKMIHDQPSLGPGVNTSYTLIKGPDQIVAKIISGEADIAALPTNLAAVLYNKGINLRLLAITNWGVNYLIGRDASVRTWNDLHGKEVAATAQGATPDILFRFMLEAHGLDPEADLRIRYYSTPIELAQLFIAGRIDLAVLPEPWVTQVLMKEANTEILLDFQAEWKRLHNQERSYPQSCLVVKTQFAEEHPELIAAFLREAAASGAWVKQNPAQAGILAEKYISIQAEAGGFAITRCNLDFNKPLEVKTEIEGFLQALYEYNPNSIGARIPDANFFH